MAEVLSLAFRIAVHWSEKIRTSSLSNENLSCGTTVKNSMEAFKYALRASCSWKASSRNEEGSLDLPCDANLACKESKFFWVSSRFLLISRKVLISLCKNARIGSMTSAVILLTTDTMLIQKSFAPSEYRFMANRL